MSNVDCYMGQWQLMLSNFAEKVVRRVGIAFKIDIAAWLTIGVFLNFNGMIIPAIDVTDCGC
jgi:hypothetical protein